MENLIETIKQIKKVNTLETKSVEEYEKYILRECKGIPEDFILNACHIYKERNLYDKPVVYLKAIIINSYREHQKKIDRELQQLGDLPISKNL